MDVAILAVDRMKKGPEAELCGRYLERARRTGRPHGLGGFAVTEVAEGREPRAADRMASEANALIAAAGDGSCLVCLDEDGEQPGSEAFAHWLGGMAAAGKPGLGFVIGGADGVAPDLLARAEKRLAFGRMTWPHQIVRILLAEQLYRATTILSNHPYHRA